MPGGRIVYACHTSSQISASSQPLFLTTSRLSQPLLPTANHLHVAWRDRQSLLQLLLSRSPLVSLTCLPPEINISNQQGYLIRPHGLRLPATTDASQLNQDRILPLRATFPQYWWLEANRKKAGIGDCRLRGLQCSQHAFSACCQERG